MIVLSHRGYWQDVSEKNTPIAFDRSFSLGFGTETDIRDLDGELIISHDPPQGGCLTVDEFFEIYQQYSPELYLALNIKADGLQEKLKKKLAYYNVGKYFVFDMSVPDALVYNKAGIATFTRESEYETSPSFYDDAIGVWLDEFNGHWIDEGTIIKHLNNAKQMCIVSPELHGREPYEEWKAYKSIEEKFGKDRLMLCTDYPEGAKEFFNG
ncbi:MAG: hypothetical protein HOD92_02260 [Deltaproteobacteria bacterium]|jgi:glycerophosphoryl diester phosphodiesterase|nr:hypothetical protein [Deltaproteobacteria bacterium]